MAHHLGGNTQGTATVTAVGTADIIAAPGAGIRLHIVRGVVSICVAGAAGTTVALDDGTTTIWEVAADDSSQLISHQIDFGDEGYHLGKNAALKLTVATGNAEAKATFVGYTR